MKSLARLLISGLLPALSAPAFAQCLPQGLTLDVEGGRMGDDFTLALAGSAFAPGLIGADLGDGPTVTPFGPVCLDFSPALVLAPFALDGAGSFQVAAPVPAVPAFEGIALFFQAFAVDPLWPTGVALSNGERMDFFPPHLYLLDENAALSGGSELVYFDPLKDAFQLSLPFTKGALDVAWVPDPGCVAVLFDGGEVRCFDGQTGVLVSSAILPALPENPTDLVATGLPGRVLVLHRGTAATGSVSGGGSASPGGVSVVLVDTGVVLHTITFASANPLDLLAVPGSNVAYAREGYDVIEVDHVLGIEGASTSFASTNGSIVDWLVHSGRLLTLFRGLASGPGGGGPAPAAMNGIDLATGQKIAPAPVPIGFGIGLAKRLRAGPGPFAGEYLFVLFPERADVVLLDPLTFAVFASQITTPKTESIELSPGSTEWLLLTAGSSSGSLGGSSGPGELSALDVQTLAVTLVFSFPMGSQVGPRPLPSDHVREAFVVSGDRDVYAFDTDPSTGAHVLSTLPVGSGGWVLETDS